MKTIKFEYFSMPISSLIVDLWYKLSGPVETDWTQGKMSASFFTTAASEAFKNYARGAAAEVLFCQSVKSGGDSGVPFKDAPVEVIDCKIETIREYPPLQTDHLVGAKIMSEKTDTLIIEYLHIPKKDTKYHFLIRYVQPMSTTFQYRDIQTMCREMKQVSDGSVKEYNKHEGLGEHLNNYGLNIWKRDITKQVSSIDHFPKDMHWWFELDKVDVRQCELVPKNQIEINCHI